ncbi:MAG: carbon-nitrogen hydrolase family protein [Burkholderiaceae bacterium]|nr:carbon-nitrogen hydrolase family protein [Burkholderiaceae bacterium]
MTASLLTVGLAQIAPIWLDREATLAKMVDWVARAGREGCQLVAFGEALLPGYPFWVELTDGARFESALQKRFYAHYAEQAVRIERGDLAPLCAAARAAKCWVLLGAMEQPAARGHSVYCSMVWIDPLGEVRNVHRKLMPTFEERLVWATGDGAGLRTFDVGPFRAGGLNCWENWMPLPRAALQAQGEDLHVALWPGNVRNTVDLTRHIAREGRSYSLAVSGLMRRADVPDHIPEAALLREVLPETSANGGSCIAGPDGQWLVEPVADVETLIVAQLDLARVREERQNFDPSGHYARPDVLRLEIDRRRQQVLIERD